MDRSRLASGIGAATGMLLLILDGKTALSGAVEGIELCIRTVIPSLFPFFVLSGILTSALMGAKLPLGLSIVPRGAESLLITGFLGGYPVGAQNISQAYRSGQLSRPQAERMLGFCSNAGPSFLFGLIVPQFPSAGYGWALWLVHIAGALLAGCCLKTDSDAVTLKAGKQIGLSDALWQALRVTGSVCGWIVLFRILIAFLDRWLLWLVSPGLRIGIIGSLELSNGCLSLIGLENIALRFCLCSCFLSLGGLCVTMQTLTVIRGLSLRYYFPGKSMQAATGMLLTWTIFPKSSFSPAFPVLALIWMGISGVFLTKMQNHSRKSQKIGV